MPTKSRARSLLHLVAVLAALALPVSGAPAESGGKGWIVVSVSLERQMTTAVVVLRAFENPETRREVGFTRSLFASDQHDWSDDSAGVVRAIELPAGAWRLASFRLESSITNRRWSPRQEFSVPFTVSAGEVTYLGEFLATGTYGKPFLGFRAVEKPYFLVSDQRARDLPIAVQETPGIGGLPVRSVAPLRSSKGSNYFLTTRAKDAPAE
jgi:hypothetical protein